jgi:hypothetical protein
MSTNPYAAFVVDQDAESLVKEFPGKLTAVISKMGPAGIGMSLGPGKWTVRQILCHLADCEIAFAFRWRQALAEQNHVVQPFDQDHWANRYTSLPADEALQTFLALRRWNARLLEELSPSDWEREVTHPERGKQTFRTLVETMAGHDLNHLRQLDKIAALALT